MNWGDTQSLLQLACGINIAYYALGGIYTNSEKNVQLKLKNLENKLTKIDNDIDYIEENKVDFFFKTGERRPVKLRFEAFSLKKSYWEVMGYGIYTPIISDAAERKMAGPMLISAFISLILLTYSTIYSNREIGYPIFTASMTLSFGAFIYYSFRNIKLHFLFLQMVDEIQSIDSKLSLFFTGEEFDALSKHRARIDS